MKAEGGKVYEGDARNKYEITEKYTQNVNMCGTIRGCGTIKLNFIAQTMLFVPE